MDGYRSKSYADGRYTSHEMQLEKSHSYAGARPGNPDPRDLRSYSASSYAASSSHEYPGPYSGHGPSNSDHPGPNIEKFKKGGSASMKNWILTDPELQRKKRVAGYKVYGVEGKVKGGFRKSFRWIKDRYNIVLHGWR